jgi:hypothetical protein
MRCGSYVRRLFDILLVSNQFSRPEYVWSKTWEHLSDDVLYRQRMILRVQGNDGLITLLSLTADYINVIIRCIGCCRFSVR